VRLTWGQPWDNVGVVKYRVYRGDEAGFEVGVGSMVAEPTFPVYTDWGGAGDPGVNHYYVVTALDANGNESAVSNMVGEFDWSTESGP
jgi:fibronectin type 3 domain-containing protein